MSRTSDYHPEDLIRFDDPLGIAGEAPRTKATPWMQHVGHVLGFLPGGVLVCDQCEEYVAAAAPPEPTPRRCECPMCEHHTSARRPSSGESDHKTWCATFRYNLGLQCNCGASSGESDLPLTQEQWESLNRISESGGFIADEPDEAYSDDSSE